MKAAFSIFLVVYAVIAYYKFYLKTRDLLNPFGVTIVVWNTIAALASLHLSHLETDWTIEMYVIVILFPAVVNLAGYTGRGTMKRSHVSKEIYFSNTYIYASRILFWICAICAVIEWKAQGYQTFFDLSGKVFDVKQSVEMVRVVHYGTVFLSYIALCSFFELCYRPGRKKRTTIYLLFTIAASIFQALAIAASRGTLLILVTGAIYICSRRFKLPLKKIAICIGCILFAFIEISTRRIFSDSLVYGTVTGHPLFSAVYSYSAMNFENLNKLTISGSSFSVAGRSLLGIFQCLGLGGLFPEKEKHMTYFFNATTICYDFYDDLWIFGVVLYTFLIFKFIQWIYVKANCDERYTLFMAGLQKAVWMVFFGNYFTSYRSVMFPYIILGGLVCLMKVRIAVGSKTEYSLKSESAGQGFLQRNVLVNPDIKKTGGNV